MCPVVSTRAGKLGSTGVVHAEPHRPQSSSHSRPAWLRGNRLSHAGHEVLHANGIRKRPAKRRFRRGACAPACSPQRHRSHVRARSRSRSRSRSASVACCIRPARCSWAGSGRGQDAASARRLATPAEVPERCAAVPKIVRRERRHASVACTPPCDPPVRKRSPPEPGEHLAARGRDPPAASRRRRHRTTAGWTGTPPAAADRSSRRRPRHAERRSIIVDVGPRERLELAGIRIPGRVEHERRQPRYCLREQLKHGEHMLSGQGGTTSVRSSWAGASRFGHAPGSARPPAKSSTIAAVSTSSRIVSAREDPSCSAVTMSATSPGVIDAGLPCPKHRHDPREVDAGGSSRCDPDTSTIRESRLRLRDLPERRSCGRIGEELGGSGTRIAASSPPTQSRRIRASRIVRNVPAPRGTLTATDTWNFTPVPRASPRPRVGTSFDPRARHRGRPGSPSTSDDSCRAPHASSRPRRQPLRGARDTPRTPQSSRSGARSRA